MTYIDNKAPVGIKKAKEFEWTTLLRLKLTQLPAAKRAVGPFSK